MLIPSIDLMGGWIVQLEQGERVVIESADVDGWIARFTRFPLVQVIDLDAAMGRGDNAALVHYVCSRLPCQVGGGLRSVEQARRMLEMGARRVIIGSALFGADGVDRTRARAFRPARTSRRCMRRHSPNQAPFLSARRTSAARAGLHY